MCVCVCVCARTCVCLVGSVGFFRGIIIVFESLSDHKCPYVLCLVLAPRTWTRRHNDPQAVCRHNVRPHLEGKPFFHYTVKRFVNNAENTKIPLASTKKTKRNISKDTTPCRRHVTGAVIMIETHTSDFLPLLDQW